MFLRPAPAVSSARAPSGPPDVVVDCNGGFDTTTIQAAIARAPDRGWIEVHPCTYDERIDFRGKTLWIASSGGAAVTEIDAGGNGTAVTARGGEGDRTALVGFTIDDANGQAVDVRLSALRLQDVVITDTDGSYAIHAQSSDVELANVTIDDSNDAWLHTIESDRGSITIRGGTFECGTGDGLFTGHGGFIVDGATILCPGDTAIEVEHAVGRIQRSVLTGDLDVLTEEDHDDDVIRVEDTTLDGDTAVSFGTFTFRNAITSGTLSFTDVADTVTIENSVFTGAGCAIDSNSVLGPIRYNDFSNGPSTCQAVNLVGVDGNFAAATLFVDPAAGDFHLQAGSPLIDAGVPEAAYRDVDGTRNDLGIFGGHFSQDGGW
ncbi:MAG: hypothetical protein ABMB14_06985 [Myxococcota bacterium]